MCDEGVGDSLRALELIHDQFASNKMIKKPFTALYADENIFHFNVDSGKILFNCNEISILIFYLGNINLDDHFDEDHPNTIILIRVLAWHIKFEKCKVTRKKQEKNCEKLN